MVLATGAGCYSRPPRCGESPHAVEFGSRTASHSGRAEIERLLVMSSDPANQLRRARIIEETRAAVAEICGHDVAPIKAEILSAMLEALDAIPLAPKEGS